MGKYPPSFQQEPQLLVRQQPISADGITGK